MSRIGIDVDGVLRDFCGSLVNVVKEKYPHYLKDEFKPEVEPSLDGGMITEWYLSNNFTCTKKELQEIKIIEEFLPKQLSENEIDRIIEELISKNNITDNRSRCSRHRN